MGADPPGASEKIPIIRAAWWYTYPSEKYDFVGWDDEIPNKRKNKIHGPNHQPAIIRAIEWVLHHICGETCP